MINLLIVDDEVLTREGLMEYMDWESLGVSGTYLAESGDEALQIMDIYTINILLCDIRMPRMDGIELAKEVRIRYPHCRIVFLSGYCDKEYLKSAIHLKADSYIEKPVDVDELKLTIKNAISELKQESDKAQSDQILISGLVETSPLIRLEIALALISPSLNYAAFKAKYYPLYFTWDEQGMFTAVCIRPDSSLGHLENNRDLCVKIYDFLESSKNPNPIDFLAGQTESGEICIVINGSARSAMQQTFSLLQQSFMQAYGITISIGLSLTCRKLVQLPDAYAQAQDAASQSFYLGSGQIICSHTGSHDNPSDETLFSKQNMNLEEVEHLFEVLKQRQYSDIENIKNHLYRIYKSITGRTLSENCIPYVEFRQNNLAQIRELMICCVQTMYAPGSDLYDTKIRGAVQYILWNYNDPDLSVKAIADQVDLSPNYLCALFKQNTHSTINDFILQIRIENTKKLLETTDLKLYEIADKVGISDPNYLSALFKRSCGQTPSKFKRHVHREAVI